MSEPVGMRVEVFWPLDVQFYPGTIVRNGLCGGASVEVSYDDGDVEILELSNEIWRVSQEKEKLSTSPETSAVGSGACQSMSSCVEPARSASGPRITSSCAQAADTPQPSRMGDEEKVPRSLAPMAVGVPSLSSELQAKKEVEAHVRAVASVKAESSTSKAPIRMGSVKRASDSPLLLDSKTAPQVRWVKSKREAKAAESEKSGTAEPGGVSSHSAASKAIAISSAHTDFTTLGSSIEIARDARSLPPKKRPPRRGTSP